MELFQLWQSLMMLSGAGWHPARRLHRRSLDRAPPFQGPIENRSRDATLSNPWRQRWNGYFMTTSQLVLLKTKDFLRARFHASMRSQPYISTQEPHSKTSESFQKPSPETDLLVYDLEDRL